MKPGIYLNMPEDTYHAIDALGSSSIKDISDDAVEYQFQKLNDEPEPESASKILGSAIHCRLLEGRAAFEKAYYHKLDTAPLIEKGALNVVDGFKDWLRDRGLNVSGTKDKLKERVREEDPRQLILDDIVEQHKIDNEGKQILSIQQWNKVLRASEWCEKDEMLAPFMTDGTFTLGLNEVSVVAEIDGVPVKARFDMLAHHAILDMKTFQPFLNKHPVEAIPYHIKKMSYLLQAGHYLNVWEAARDLYKRGLIFGSYPEGFFDKVFAREKPTWLWLFIKTTGAPQPYVRGLSPDCYALTTARNNAREALILWQQMGEKYGHDQLWPPANKAVELGDEELL